MKHHSTRTSSRGTSLVEALVALAVMAFGMLAVLGIQATLRSNSDISKQRSEAVRIAQEEMERARAFSTIDTTAGQMAYADIVEQGNVPFDDYTTNTTFTLSRTVVVWTNPDRKELRIRVEWKDRNWKEGDPVQRVELNGVIGANDPRVSLALGAQPKGIPERQPWGRHRGIPPQAKGIGGGLSVFKPPVRDTDNGSIVWVIDDQTGLIVGICDSIATRQEDLTAADVANCNNTTAQILSGYVRFSTDLTQPTAAESENATSTALNLSIGLDLTSTGHPDPDRRCFDDAPTTPNAAALTTVVRYYCAVHSNSSRVWSGTSTVLPRAFNGADLDGVDYVPWTIASDATDAAVTRYRVCRYTPATSDAQEVPNRQHPRTYNNVTALEPLTNQNFLVIRAGDGTVAFNCPTDVAANPAAGDFVNSNTLSHQPPP